LRITEISESKRNWRE